MSDEKSQKEVITAVDDLPGGLLGVGQGESQDQVARGLFEALGSDPESLGIEDLDDDGAGGEDDDGADDHSGEDDDDSDESAEDDEELEDDESDDDEEFEEDDESDDGDEGDDELLELTDELIIEDVPLPGGDKTSVSLGELKAGYSREADYTRKRQAAAEEQRTAMAEIGEIRSQYKARLARAQQILEDMAPPEPSAELRQENPGEYAAQVAERKAYLDAIDTVGAEETRVTEEEQREYAQKALNYRNAEWAKVVDRYPEWEKQEVALPQLASLRDFAISEYGFLGDEIDGLIDSRLFFVLKDLYEAKQGDAEAAKSVSKKRKKAKKRLKPGSSGTAKRGRKRSKRRKAREAVDQRARETGSVIDAARSLELMLEDEDL